MTHKARTKTTTSNVNNCNKKPTARVALISLKTKRKIGQTALKAFKTNNLNVISNVIILLVVSLNLLTITNLNNATTTTTTNMANATLSGQEQQEQQQQVSSSPVGLITEQPAPTPTPTTPAEKRSLVPNGRPRRPDSSSSMFAEVEDLSDSSIRTRLGTVIAPPAQPANAPTSSNIEHLGDSPNDFDKLVDRMLAPTGATNANGNQLSPTSPPADPYNNRTSMRFFRNNKTFASIVYTNSEQQQQQQQQQQHPRQPKRLINCHLVDLEKHSSDVALYESKYDIRTVDVEFREMMQLIEACTNIARLRWRPTPANQPAGAQHNQSSAPNAAQLFAASLPVGGHNQHHHQQQQHQSGGVRPLVVVGRPLMTTSATSSTSSTTSEQPPAANSLVSFQSVMTGALSNELRRLPPGATRDDSNRLDLPQRRQLRRRSHVHTYRRRRSRTARNSRGRSLGVVSVSTGPPPPPPPPQQQPLVQPAQHLPGKVAQKLLSKAIEKVGETTKSLQKKLVLGEVTAPPTANDDGSFREALQEITNYDTTDLLAIWRGILPGTNWCGMGDRATSYNDLGFESDIDICCRAHDFCPVRLAAFSSGYGLFNWSFYTRSHCWCDQNFLDCLQRAESPLSAVVMKFYFTIMKTTCLNDNETNALASQLGKSHRSFFSVHTSTNGSQPMSSSSSSSSPWRPAFNRIFSGANSKAGAHVRDNGDQSSVNANHNNHINNRQLQQPAGPPIPALRQSQAIQTRLEGQQQQRPTSGGRALVRA